MVAAAASFHVALHMCSAKALDTQAQFLNCENRGSGGSVCVSEEGSSQDAINRTVQISHHNYYYHASKTVSAHRRHKKSCKFRKSSSVLSYQLCSGIACIFGIGGK